MLQATFPFHPGACVNLGKVACSSSNSKLAFSSQDLYKHWKTCSWICSAILALPYPERTVATRAILWFQRGHGKAKADRFAAEGTGKPSAYTDFMFERKGKPAPWKFDNWTPYCHLIPASTKVLPSLLLAFVFRFLNEQTNRFCHWWWRCSCILVGYDCHDCGHQAAHGVQG